VVCADLVQSTLRGPLDLLAGARTG
jgi:hypothetical protein